MNHPQVLSPVISVSQMGIEFVWTRNNSGATILDLHSFLIPSNSLALLPGDGESERKKTGVAWIWGPSGTTSLLICRNGAPPYLPLQPSGAQTC